MKLTLAWCGKEIFTVNTKVCLSIFLIMMLLVLSGCVVLTPIGGLHKKPTASPENGFTLKICVFRDENFSEEQVHTRFNQWNEALGSYGIKAVVTGEIDILPRKGFLLSTNASKMKMPLGRAGQPSCDRIIYFLGRHAGDVIYGILGTQIPLPEIVGAVDPTSTRMCIVGETATLGHLIAGGAKNKLIHEGFHLLGCGHYSWKNCSLQIERLKRLASDNPEQPDFIPALTADGRVCRTRTEVDIAFFGFEPCPKVFETN